MHDIESTNVLLSVNNHTRTTHVTTPSDHNNITSVEFDKVCDLVLFEIELNCIVNIDIWVRITDRPAVVGYNVRDTLRANGHFFHFEELVGGFFCGDAMNCETTFDIVKETELFVGFFESNYI
jgi:hypothetical protein